MSDVPPAMQWEMGKVNNGNVRYAIAVNVQPDSVGKIAILPFDPEGGFAGWERIRVTNYTPYPFLVSGVPDGGPGTPPELIAPFQQNVWPFYSSKGHVALDAAVDPSSPLAVPPLRFAYGEGTAKDQLLFNWVMVEWTDTPALFAGYYPVPLTGIAIDAEAVLVDVPVFIPVGSDPVAIAVDQGANRVYVANNGDDTVTVIDGLSHAVIGTTAVGAGPQDIASNESQGQMLVTVTAAGGLDVVSTASPFPNLGFIATGAGSWGVAADNTSHNKYVSRSTGANTVVPLDAADVPQAPIATGVNPKGVALDSVTGLVYVANATDGTVTVIDEATGLVVGIPIVVGTNPLAVAVDEVLNLIYVANHDDDTVSVIDGATALVTATIGVGNGPVDLVVNPDLARVYTADNLGNTVTVIDENTATVIDTVSPGVGPTAVAWNSTGEEIWVAITADAVVVLSGI